MGMLLLSFWVALVAAYVYVEEEDRDPDEGWSANLTFAWVKQTAQYDPEEDAFYNIAHYYDWDSFYYPDNQTKRQSSDQYHPYTELFEKIYKDNEWQDDTHALVIW
jgi:hypothetical protein